MDGADRDIAADRFAALEVDGDGRIVGWSAAAERMFGCSLAELQSRRLSALLDDGVALGAPAARASFAQAVVCRRKNGKTFHASILMTPVATADGGAERLAVLVVDDERERNRERYIASVAHDLRQPISLIQTASYLLEKHESSGAALELLRRINAAAAQLTDLSNEIVDFGTARLGGEIVLEREPTSLSEVVDEVCGSFSVGYADRLIALPSADALAGPWDRKRLRRLVQNLVENALTHSPPTTPVRVACRRSGAEAELAVENECPEPPAASLEQLFEPFRRASDRGRVGLGLYIARELARAHGGAVTASWSTGTIVFLLSLPTATATLPPEPRASDAPPPLFATQRRHRRLPLDRELEIAVRDELFRAQGRDVSLAGLAFWSSVELKVDERVEVGVSAGPTSFRVLGTVRHVNRVTDRSLVGIEFASELSPVEVELLKRPLRS
ncbi:MAG TPA: ATP-binding protein [Polyangia bacterium]